MAELEKIAKTEASALQTESSHGSHAARRPAVGDDLRSQGVSQIDAVYKEVKAIANFFGLLRSLF